MKEVLVDPERIVIRHSIPTRRPDPGESYPCVGGVSSPLLSNLYLNEVDKMLERVKAETRRGRFTYMEYARFADDIVILVDGYRERWTWLARLVYRRLTEELANLDVQINTGKTVAYGWPKSAPSQ